MSIPPKKRLVPRKAQAKAPKQKPFICVVTSCRRRMHAKSSNFASYDLSKEEIVFEGNFTGPMKSVCDEQRQVLNSGKRNAYLTLRYDHSPDSKYYYPEATSWRYGWLHNIKCKMQKDETSVPK